MLVLVPGAAGAFDIETTVVDFIPFLFLFLLLSLSLFFFFLLVTKSRIFAKCIVKRTRSDPFNDKANNRTSLNEFLGR